MDGDTYDEALVPTNLAYQISIDRDFHIPQSVKGINAPNCKN